MNLLHLQPRACAIGAGKVAHTLDLSTEGDRTDLLRLSATAPGASEVVIELTCAVDEHFAGLGEQFTQVDKRGRVVDGVPGREDTGYARYTKGLDHAYKLAPLYYSSKGYGAFIDDLRPWRIDLGASDPTRVRFSVFGDSATVVLATGPPHLAIPRITGLTGRPPLIPPWGYGAWKNVSGDEDRILAEAQRLRSEQMGVSALWMFAFYDAETNTGCGAGGTYPTATYEDLPALVRQIHDHGYRALTYLNGWFYCGTLRFEEAERQGYLLRNEHGRTLLVNGMYPPGGEGPGHTVSGGLPTLEKGTAFLDFTNPDARAWWRGLLRQVLVDQDFDGWMQDFGEGLPLGAQLSDQAARPVADNEHPLLYHGTALEEIQQTKPEALFFARSGSLGTQARAPVLWPSDQTRDWSRWSGIGCLPAAGISAGLMGVAAWGPDIGGCMGFEGLGHGYGSGYLDRELWIRWCQLSAMTPVMRDHLGFHDAPPVDAWFDAETIDTWRRCAAWHNRLFPYLYTFAHRASASGLPVLRGMMIEFPEDPTAWVLSDQYLLGDSLLCAPVIEAGATSRRVYLPDGHWYDWWSGARYEGSGWIEVEAPLERWPVLQRAGSIVPLLADEVPRDLNDPGLADGAFDLELVVAPGAGRALTLFDGTDLVPGPDGVAVRGGRTRRFRVRPPGGTPGMMQDALRSGSPPGF
ncbi:MAG: TIM-barrel domain-containing protein [Candidatus Dormibacteria bacterium]